MKNLISRPMARYASAAILGVSIAFSSVEIVARRVQAEADVVSQPDADRADDPADFLR